MQFSRLRFCILSSRRLFVTKKIKFKNRARTLWTLCRIAFYFRNWKGFLIVFDVDRFLVESRQNLSNFLSLIKFSSRRFNSDRQDVPSPHVCRRVIIERRGATSSRAQSRAVHLHRADLINSGLFPL